MSAILLGIHIQYKKFHGGEGFAAEQEKIAGNIVALAQNFNHKALGRVVGVELSDRKSSFNWESNLVPAFRHETREHVHSYMSSPFRDATYGWPQQGSRIFVMGYNAAYCVSDTVMDLAEKSKKGVGYTVYLVADCVGSQSLHSAQGWDEAQQRKLAAAGVIFVQAQDVQCLVCCPA